MGKLLAVRTAESLAENIEKSGLLSASQLDQAKAICGESSDLKAAARRLVGDKLLTVWQAKQLLGGFHALKFGKYRLMDEIGTGGLGRVYLAEHMQLGRRVALKVLSKRHSDKAEVVEQFLSQAREVSALDHRNLIHVYDVGSEGDRYFVVMEHALGQDLEQIVRARGALPFEEVAGILCQVATGLEYAHAKGVTHLDLKPSNVLFDKQGVVKILDMGVATLSGTADVATNDSTEITAVDPGYYQAPEQRAEGAALTARTDMFSLGAIGYFLLTGKTPFCKGEGPQAQRTDTLQPLALLRDGVPEELAAVCNDLLATEVEARPASLAATISKLTEWLAAQRTAIEAEAKAAEEARTALGFTPKSGAPPAKRKLMKAKLLEETPVADEVTPNEDTALEDTNPRASVETISRPASDFTLNVKGKGKSKSAARNEEDFVVPEKKMGASKKKSAKSSNKNQKVLLLAAAGGAGVFVLLGMMVGGYILLFSKPNTEVAQNAPTTGQPVENATTTDPAANPSATTDTPMDPATDTSKTDTPAGEIVAPMSDDKNATNATATEKVNDIKPPVPMTGDNATPPDATKSTTPETKTDPNKTTPPNPTKAAATPKKEEPKKGTEIASAAPTTPAKTTPPPNPFKSLPVLFELPPLPAEGTAEDPAPVDIGPVTIEKRILCVLNLAGGETAYKSAKHKFVIENGDSGTATRDWDIFLRTMEGKEGEGTRIASVSLRDKLTFAWTKEAAKEKNSQYLANVKLTLRASASTHDIGFRKPVEGEGIPIVIDGKTQMKTSVKLTSLPDPEKLMVRIWLDAALPKHQFDLGLSAIDAKDGKTYVVFGERPEDSILRLLVESKLTPTSVDLNVVPYYQFVGQPKPAPYNTKSKKEIQNLPGMRDLAYKAILDTKKRFPMPKNAPPQFTQQLAAMEEEAKKLESAAAQLDRLVATEGAVSKQGNLHFMIYYKADDKVVALYQTAVPPPPKKQ